MLICTITGSRGRSIAVYDNKCVITTDVTLGSILTSNALDGQKTIFYIDIVGVQFKRCGLAIGYLQFETSSIQMNNQSSNMFSENTFTFEEIGGVSNSLMEAIHDYIVNRIENFKYGSPEQKHFLYKLVSAAEKASGCYVESSIVIQVKNEIKEQAEKSEQERAEKQRREYEAQQRAIVELQRSFQGKDASTQIELFLAQASTCKRVMEIYKLWKNFAWDDNNAIAVIDKKISNAAQIERMYGSSSNDVQRILDEIKKMIYCNG